jgi:predicted porin
MYKRLLASTALVAAGMVGASAVQAQTAPASQPLQVTVGGYFEQTFGYAKNKDGVTASLGNRGDVLGPATATTISKPNKWAQFNDSEIWFNVKGTLANGITVGARVELEANTERDTIDESFLFVEGAFGRIDMGSTDAASFKTHVSVPSIGKAYTVEQSTANDWIYGPVNVSTSTSSRTSTANSDNNIISYYTPRFAGLQVGATYAPSATQDIDNIADKTTTRTGIWSVGANFTRAFGAVNLEASLGWEHSDSLDTAAANTAGGDDIDEYTAGLRVGFAGFSVGGGYKKTDSGVNTNDGDIWSVGLSYTFGPATVGIQYLSDKVQGVTTNAADDKHKLALIGGNYTLGPGVDLFANVFNQKWTDESSTAAADNNKGTGAIAGLRLTF